MRVRATPTTERRSLPKLLCLVMTSADLQANEIARLQFEYLWGKKLQTDIKYRFTSCLRKIN